MLFFLPLSLAQPSVVHEMMEESSVSAIATHADSILIPLAEIETLSDVLWTKHQREEQGSAKRIKEMEDKLMLHEQATMRYTIQFKGEKPKEGYPLYIALHGGGGGTAQMNDGQWKHMSSYYLSSIDSGAYVAARGITNNWNLHFDSLSYPFYDRLIDNLILLGDVDPDRVYFLGFSAGGDGVYQIAPRMTDRLAGVNMSAGHPNGTSAINLYTLPFLIQMGERDGAYNRNRVAAEYHQMLTELQKVNPEGYIHDLFLHKGGGHNSPWRDNNPRSQAYPVIKNPAGWLEDVATHQQSRSVDSNAVRWLSQQTRNPHPSHLIWQTQTQAETRGERAQSHYWFLNISKNQLIAVRIENNTFVIEQAQHDFTILIDPALVDLSKSVSVTYNGVVLFSGIIEPDLRYLARSYQLRNDPQLGYVAAIPIDISP